MKDRTGKSGAGGNDKPPSYAGVLFAGLCFFILGGMALDFRILTTGAAGLVVSILAFPAEKLGLLSRRMSGYLRAGVMPCVAVFWIGVTLYQYYIEKEYVVSTPEYWELHPRHVEWNIDPREADLTEQAAFRVNGKQPVIDGTTSFLGMYRSICSVVGVDSMNMLRSKTPGAYQHLVDGVADLIFVFRPSARQIADAAEKGREFSITPIGHDAFVFFVNKDNPLDNLTIRQVKDMYSGKIRNWKEVGGRDESIAAFQRYEGSGSQSRMERFMSGEELMTPDKEHRFYHMLGIVVNVARYRNYQSAIGYSFYLYVDTMLSGGGVKLLSIDGIAPSTETIRDGSYPLVDEICVVTAGSENPNVAPMIEWILSPQGQAIVETVGYVPIAPAKPDAAKLRLRQ